MIKRQRLVALWYFVGGRISCLAGVLRLFVAFSNGYF